MIERWLVAIRENPNRPPAAQCHVLTMLALRLDWMTGRGFASVQQLGADGDASKATVKRSTKWARDNGYAVQLRRGHRINAERKAASVWQLTEPGYPQAESQGLTGEPLEKPRAQNGKAKGSAEQPKGSPQTPYQESVVPQDLYPSSELIALIIEEIKNATGRTIGPQWAARTAKLLLDGRSAANPGGYIRTAIRGDPDPKTRFLSLYDHRDQA